MKNSYKLVQLISTALLVMCLTTRLFAGDEEGGSLHPKLEASYQEVDGRPILRVTLTNIGESTFYVANEFIELQTTIEVLDHHGKNLLHNCDTKPKKVTRITELPPEIGIARKLDLLKGVTSISFGHSVGDGHMHIASNSTVQALSAQSLSKIHSIRVSLLSKSELQSQQLHSFNSCLESCYGADAEKAQIFQGGARQQVVEIVLKENCDRAAAQFGTPGKVH